MPASAVVVGSLNMDLTMRTPRAPRAGETMFGRGFALSEGGKGANQAVAIARMGASVALVGKIGGDGFGRQIRTALCRDGVVVDLLTVSPDHATGVAMIMVEDSGENRIVLAPGANAALCADDIDAATGLIGHAAFVVLQLEVPISAIVHAARLAKRLSSRVILNPAPAAELPSELWHLVDYLIPNETEAEMLTGVHIQDPVSASEAAQALHSRGASNVMITLGAKGVFISDHCGQRLLPARKVEVKDTTAAGDCFIGGFVAGLTEARTVDQSVQLGIAAASLCVSRPGAQAALPFRAELAMLDLAGDTVSASRKKDIST